MNWKEKFVARFVVQNIPICKVTMRLSYETLVSLARGGDEEAIGVLRNAENKTSRQLEETEFYFQEGLGLFYMVNDRRKTIIGMPIVNLGETNDLCSSEPG